MAEPLTKEELALARGYAESVYADTSDPQKHAAAVMMLRLLDTLAALEAEYARLREKAGEWLEYRRDALETGSEDIAEAYMMADDALVAAIDAALKEGNDEQNTTQA